jgi:putative flavoprotein involved in K+ transport
MTCGRAGRLGRLGRTVEVMERIMDSIDTVIIGGGQAGLAMSRALSERGVEHVVLERGRVGERWRNERWDSLHLLTPRWLSRLSGWDDGAADPDGFMNRGDVIRYLEAYRGAFAAPVVEGVTVTSVEREEPGYRVETNSGVWSAHHVVVATGESQGAFVPRMARDLASWVHQVVPTRYRNPDEMGEGGVLVVGASATGIQLAQEIQASGRPVTLSVGRHTRLPRRYRGRDILEWFHRMGTLDQDAAAVRSLDASRNQPSLQLTGSVDHATVDLRLLQEEGVRLVGRAEGGSGSRMYFADELVETMAAADMKLAGLRVRIDQYIRDQGLTGVVGPEEPFYPVPLTDAPDSLDLRTHGIRTVLWATGFTRSYPWLRVPVLDAGGEIRHHRGITAAAGLYVLGLNFQRRRSSSFLAGVGRDAEELADHLAQGRKRRDGRAALAVA